MFYYSTTFLQGVIDSPAVGTALVGFINVLATMFASALMDSHRRRSMLILSIVGMLAGALVLTLALNGSLGNAWALAGVGSYVFFFELGLGPIPWMIVPELFTADKVVQSQSAGSQINWTMNVVVGLGFPALNAALGAYAFVPFALVLVATLLFVLVALPETYGRTPEDVFGTSSSASRAATTPRATAPSRRSSSSTSSRVRRRTSRGRGAGSSSPGSEFTREVRLSIL